MKTNTIENYLSLPYTIVLKKDEDGDFVARIEELRGCIAHGKDEAEAIRRLKEIQALWIEDALEAGDPIPAPSKEEPLPSGKCLLRFPRSLHRDLIADAKREEVSLNQLIITVLSGYVGARKTSPTLCYLDAGGMGGYAHTVTSFEKFNDSMWNPYGGCILSGAGASSIESIAVTKQMAGVKHMMPGDLICTYDTHTYEPQTKKTGQFTF